MLASWATAGVPLPAGTVTQKHAGTPVPIHDIAPGDLVFIPGSLGTPDNPRHNRHVRRTRHDRQRLRHHPPASSSNHSPNGKVTSPTSAGFMRHHPRGRPLRLAVPASAAGAS
ncbi:hypothetical protein [Pseudonocardia sp. Ae707_Ps2]|uniref:hypothetical protein n=1 Tax=Pseudonocardia sp. Ae707_Ps2 TaxID=2212992 RepID=UPI00307DA55C